jgi:hypothetical protein
MHCKMGSPAGSQAYGWTLAGEIVPLDEPSVANFLPHRELRARGAPRIHHLGVRSRLKCDPLKKIEDQRFNGLAQACLQGSADGSGAT